MTDHLRIALAQLNPKVGDLAGNLALAQGALADARAQFERRFIEMALARAAGKRARAARELGLSRQGLLKIMARLGLSE